MNTINFRISQIITYFGMNQNSFSKKIGMDNNVTIGNIVKGRKNKPSYDVIEKIILTFDSINSDWLITGKGEMIKGSNINSNTISEPQKEYNKNKVCKECAILKEQIFNLNKLIRSYEKQIELLEEKLKDCLETSPKKKAS